ncbi:MAG: AIR carboxylase family protein [Chitinophagaceae bacterium]
MFYQKNVISAHRIPDLMYAFAKGIKVIIAGAGLAAHVPGMLAVLTPIPNY